MENLYGFENQKKYLLNKYNNNSLPNSILFYGNKGIGKKTFIYHIISIFFKNVVTEDKILHHLNLISNNSHPNLKYITRDIDHKSLKEKNSITIDQIRNLETFLYESSLDGFDKFVIIDSADDLNNNSSNSLLKFLEEPKNNTYFFLISNQLSSLLSTIKSRCLKIKFQNHNFENFKKILNTNTEINDENVKFLFDLSHGSPGIAISIYEEDILEIYDESLISLLEKDPISKLNINFADKVSKFSNDKFKIFLSILKFILINLNKIHSEINIFNYYLSNKFENLIPISSKLNKNLIHNKLEYLINNENDLFEYNLDKKIFILNFFGIVKD